MKHSKPVFPLAFAVFLCISTLSYGDTKNGTALAALIPGRTLQAVLEGTPDDFQTDIYRIVLTDDMVQAEFEILNADLDIDIFLSKKGNLTDFSQAEFGMASNDHVEKLTVNRFWGDGKLESGTWYFYVVGSSDNRHIVPPKGSYSLSYKTVLSNYVSIREGIHEGNLTWNTGMTAFFQFDIPAGISVFRVAVQGNYMDADFYLSKDNPVLSRDEADILGITYLSRESLTIRQSDTTIPLQGKWYLVLTSAPSQEHPDIFRLALSHNADLPASFKTFPQPLTPVVNTPLERAASAVVEIVHLSGGGSGVLVSSDGLILTNNHVVTGPDGKPLREVAVGLNVNIGHPSTELFWAELLWSDKDKDLAILKVRRGLYDQDLPRTLQFPFIGSMRFTPPSLGEEIWILGYPGLGGSGSKTSLTLSRGIVSGFEDTWFGRIIKSDAEINHGNSGGASLDKDLRLFAVPTSTISDSGGQLGFLHPLSLIPAEWREKMGR